MLKIGGYYFLREPTSFGAGGTVYCYTGISERGYHELLDIETLFDYWLDDKQTMDLVELPPVILELIEIGDFS